MSKRSDKRKAKKAAKERKRKIAIKKKLENIKKSERDTKKKSISVQDTLEGLQKDIKDQISNIDGAKKVCRSLKSFIDIVISRRLNLPYLTDEIRNKFRELEERIGKTIDHVNDIRRKFIETSVKLQDPGSLSTDMESLKKYSAVLTGAQELMTMQTSLIDFSAECSRFINDLDKLINECEKLRKEYGDASIMPIATPEEQEFLGVDFDPQTGTFKFVNNKFYEDHKDDEEEKVEVQYDNGHEPEEIEDAVIVNDTEDTSEKTEHKENDNINTEFIEETSENNKE